MVLVQLRLGKRWCRERGLFGGAGRTAARKLEVSSAVLLSSTECDGQESCLLIREGSNSHGRSNYTWSGSPNSTGLVGPRAQVASCCHTLCSGAAPAESALVIEKSDLPLP